MKTILFLILMFAFAFMTFEMVSNNETKIISSSQASQKIKSKSLKELQDIFLSIDVNSKELDIDRAIKAIKQARETYPLDDKLKMVDIELEHRRASETN